MPKLSRRHFVATGAASIGATALLPLGRAQAATVVRSNVNTPAGQAMLNKYAQAVKLMKAKPHGDPLSWQFQWYTHAVPSNTTKAAQLQSVYGPNPSPNKTLATQMWNTCQAHFSAAAEPFFLPWHRMYVCFFENIIRKVINDPTFALPYWDYTVPAGFSIPAQFRMQNDPVFGALFQANRRQPVNAGQAIFTGIGAASDLSPASVLGQTHYLPVGAVPGFNQALDQGLHGNVHVFVGGNQNMGAVPFAAQDPIFWMHHCNIDRLWVIWNQTHPNPNTANYLNTSFVFAGQNGQKITGLVKDFINTAKCGYRYDTPATATPVVASAAPPRGAMMAAAPAPTPPAPTVLASPAQSGAIALGTGPTRINLRVTAPAPAPAPGAPPPAAPPPAPPPTAAAPSVQGQPNAALAPLGARLQALPAERRIFVVISDLSAATTPEALYRVYLDLPEGTPDDPVNSHYLGSFNFFDAGAGGHEGDHQGASKPFSFDATNVIANLQARGALKQEHNVSIVPSGQPSEDAKPVVGSISIVEQ